MPKSVKAEVDCWSDDSRMAIEDPFESWYNVSHVLKPSSWRYIRSEYARAYTVISQTQGMSEGQVREPGEIIAKICEEAPVPPYLRNKQDKNKEANLTVTEG